MGKENVYICGLNEAKDIVNRLRSTENKRKREKPHGCCCWDCLYIRLYLLMLIILKMVFYIIVSCRK